MRRTILATITLFMLLLAAALAGLWIRSYHAKDRLIWNRPVYGGNSSSSIELASSRGRLCLSWDRLTLVGPAPAVARHMVEAAPLVMRIVRKDQSGDQPKNRPSAPYPFARG